MRKRSRDDGLPFPDRAAMLVATIMSGHPGEPVAAVNGLIECVRTFSVHFGHNQRRVIVDQLRHAAAHLEHLDDEEVS